MLKYKKIKIGKKYIEAVSFRLLGRNLIVLRGSKGYVMCGYLDMKTAEKFKEAAIKIVKVSTIKEALEADVYASSIQAKKLGVEPGDTVRDALKLIA